MTLNPIVLLARDSVLAITELTVENQLAPRKEEFEITSKAKMKTTFFLVIERFLTKLNSHAMWLNDGVARTRIPCHNKS